VNNDNASFTVHENRHGSDSRDHPGVGSGRL
jgi:hypothetical protein